MSKPKISQGTTPGLVNHLTKQGYILLERKQDLLRVVERCHKPLKVTLHLSPTLWPKRSEGTKLFLRLLVYRYGEKTVLQLPENSYFCIGLSNPKLEDTFKRTYADVTLSREQKAAKPKKGGSCVLEKKQRRLTSRARPFPPLGTRRRSYYAGKA